MFYRDENNEWQELVLEPSGDTLPIGAIVSYGSLTAPTNWLVCDGSAVSRTTYADLFAVIGTSYGSGDGSTTFNLPDLRGRVPVGKSTDTEFDTLGETGGEKTHTLTVDEIPSHNHPVSLEGTEISDLGAAWTGWTQPPTRRNYAGVDLAQYTGGGQAHNNLQPYQVVCFIIKAEDSAGVLANVTNAQNDSTKDTYSCDYVNNLVEDVGQTIEDITKIETINLLEANGTAQIVKQKFYKQGKHIWGDALVKGESNFSSSYQYPCKLIYDYPNTADSDLTCVLCYGEFTASSVGYMFINYNQKNIMISDTNGGNDKQYAKIHLDFVLN